MHQDLINQIQHLKQRIETEQHSFSHLDMVHNVLPILKNMELVLAKKPEINIDIIALAKEAGSIEGNCKIGDQFSISYGGFERFSALLEAEIRDAERYRKLLNNLTGNSWNQDDFAILGIRIPKKIGTCAFDDSKEAFNAAVDALTDKRKLP